MKEIKPITWIGPPIQMDCMACKREQATLKVKVEIMTYMLCGFCAGLSEKRLIARLRGEKEL